MAIHPQQAEMIKQSGRNEVMQKQQQEQQIAGLTNQAYEQGAVEGHQVGMQDGAQQAYGDQQAAQVQQMAEELAMAIVQGQVDPQELMARLGQMEDGPEAQVIQLALQMAEQMMQEGQLAGEIPPEQQNGPAGVM